MGRQEMAQQLQSWLSTRKQLPPRVNSAAASGGLGPDAGTLHQGPCRCCPRPPPEVVLWQPAQTSDLQTAREPVSSLPATIWEGSSPASPTRGLLRHSCPCSWRQTVDLGSAVYLVVVHEWSCLPSDTWEPSTHVYTTGARPVVHRATRADEWMLVPAPPLLTKEPEAGLPILAPERIRVCPDPATDTQTEMLTSALHSGRLGVWWGQDVPGTP